MSQETITQICSNAKILRLFNLTANAADLLQMAGSNTPSNDDFLLDVLERKVATRKERQLIIRQKLAKLPMNHDLDRYDYSRSNGLSVTQLKQLCELNWIDQCFNIMLTGPSGVGKTMIAADLCHDALLKWYKAYFRCMDDLLSMLRLKDLAASPARESKRLRNAQLIVIDDLMNFSFDREDGNRFFSFINYIYESTSLIITTNRSPAEWAKTLNDNVLATALLDRLLYKCQLIQLKGPSYRLRNRKTIF